MPKVGQLKGAQKIHVLLFESDGKLWQKNLPSENFYKPNGEAQQRTLWMRLTRMDQILIDVKLAKNQ